MLEDEKRTDTTIFKLIFFLGCYLRKETRRKNIFVDISSFFFFKAQYFSCWGIDFSRKTIFFLFVFLLIFLLGNVEEKGRRRKRFVKVLLIHAYFNVIASFFNDRSPGKFKVFHVSLNRIYSSVCLLWLRNVYNGNLSYNFPLFRYS